MKQLNNHFLSETLYSYISTTLLHSFFYVIVFTAITCLAKTKPHSYIELLRTETCRQLLFNHISCNLTIEYLAQSSCYQIHCKYQKKGLFFDNTEQFYIARSKNIKYHKRILFDDAFISFTFNYMTDFIKDDHSLCLAWPSPLKYEVEKKENELNITTLHVKERSNLLHLASIYDLRALAFNKCGDNNHSLKNYDLYINRLQSFLFLRGVLDIQTLAFNGFYCCRSHYQIVCAFCQTKTPLWKSNSTYINPDNDLTHTLHCAFNKANYHSRNDLKKTIEIFSQKENYSIDDYIFLLAKEKFERISKDIQENQTPAQTLPHCSICNAGLATYTFKPCMHNCLCLNCTLAVFQHKKKKSPAFYWCPVCGEQGVIRKYSPAHP